MATAFQSILVVGAGKMGSALVEGWLAEGVEPASITLLDPAFENDDAGWSARGVTVAADVSALDDVQPDLLMLAIKPQMMDAVLPSLSGFDRAGLAVVSIAAGTALATLQSAFPQALCVRTMPNTPAAVGAGITAAFAPDIDESMKDAVTGLLEAVGKVVWVNNERAMDAVTAVSGSGPAYVFHMVEALAEAGVKLGLPEATAMTLARETVVGAGALMAHADESAAQLRVNVTSPGGTTAAGLAVLRDGERLGELMADTTRAAYERSIALAASKPEADA